MNASTDASPRTEDTDAEIELSAEELSALSDVRPAKQVEAAPALSPTKTLKQPSRNFRLPLVLTAAGSIAAAIVAVTTSTSMSSPEVRGSAQVAQVASATPAQAESHPVRFANPFDASEVFEFPAGTSESQARDAVAELLLQRAMSRQKT